MNRRQARILCAWELGAGTAHIHRPGAVARGLAQRGHSVAFASRLPGRTAGILAEPAIRMLQAPLPTRPAAQPIALNLAEALINDGWLDPANLLAVTRAWLDLLGDERPHMVLTEAAPTALLASRIAGLPRAVIGEGYGVPPRLAPMPSIQPWVRATPGRLAAAEAAVVESANRVIGMLDGAPVAALHELYDVQQTFLCTFPAFDHYAERGGEARHRGPIADPPLAEPARWPPGEGPRLFLCYPAAYPHFEALLRDLRRLGVPTVAVAGGATPEQAEALSTGRMHVSARQLGLAEVYAARPLAITYAGHGTVASTALAGCPQLLLPYHAEQALLTFHMAEAGLARMLITDDPAFDFAALIEEVLADTETAARLRAVAARHAGFDATRELEAMTDRCAALASA